MSRSCQPWISHLHHCATVELGSWKFTVNSELLAHRSRRLDEILPLHRSFGRFFSSTARIIEQERDLSVANQRPPRSTDIVKSLCRAIGSNAWTLRTEQFLKPYSQQLSSQLVASVVLQKPVSLAQRFFEWADQRVHLDSHAYHALLTKMGEFKQFAEMWALLETMKTRGCEITSTTLCLIIKAYGAASMPHECMVVFSRAHQFGVDLDVPMYIALLGVLFKAKMMEQAKFTFQRMLQDTSAMDSTSWAVIIRGFGINGCSKEAEKCWNDMIESGFKPRVVHYNCLIEGFCESKSMNKALFTLAAMQDDGLKPNAYTFNPILGALCKTGRFSEALNIFFSMKHFCAPNQATCNILLEGLFLNGETEKACELFELMEQEGLVDTRSYFLMTSGLKKAKEMDKLFSICQSLHAKHGNTYDVVSNTLLQCLCENSNMEKAVSFFNSLENPNVASFAMMINCYCKAGKLDEAMNLLAEMDNKDCEPNAFCYTPLLGAVLKANRIHDGLRLFKDMIRRGIETNDITCGFLLRKLGQANMVDDVIKVCSHVMDNNISIKWHFLGPLIKYWKDTGRAEDADTLLRALKRHGCINGQTLEDLKSPADASASSKKALFYD